MLVCFVGVGERSTLKITQRKHNKVWLSIVRVVKRYTRYTRDILTTDKRYLSMSRTYLEDYLTKHPNAELIDGYPLDTQSEQRFVLCVKKAGYLADCLIGDHPDCRDCWNGRICSFKCGD